MRSYVKKRRYQIHVRENCLSGLENRADGSWATSSGCPQGVSQNVREGCAGAEPGVGRPRKGGKVKPHPEIYHARF